MICNDCRRDDKETLPDSLPIEEVLHYCRTWKCRLCRRTPEQIQADFDTQSARESHKSAHDWERTPEQVPNVELTGGALAPSSDRRERG